MAHREYAGALSLSVEVQTPDIVFAETILARITKVNHFGGSRHSSNLLTRTLRQFLDYHQHVPGGAMIGRATQPDLDEMVPEYTSMYSAAGGIVHGIAIPDNFSDLVYQNPPKQIKALIAAMVTAWHQELNDNFQVHSRPVMDAVETAQALFDQALQRNPSLMVELCGFEPQAFSM